MDLLTGTYFVAFAAGSGYALLSWLLAAGDGHGGKDATDLVHGHEHTTGPLKGSGHAGGKALHLEGLAASAVAPFLNVTALSGMAAAGGGAGYLARLAGAGELLSLAAALPPGLAAGYGISALVSWLHRGTRVLPDTELRGTLATVLAPTGPDAIGEIQYASGRSRASLPARSSSGQILEPGTEVVVTDVRDGIALVAPPGEVLADASREPER